MECCGVAIRDAEKAIEMDPSYGKGCGVAYPGYGLAITVAPARIFIRAILKRLLGMSSSAWRLTRPMRISALSYLQLAVFAPRWLK